MRGILRFLATSGPWRIPAANLTSAVVVVALAAAGIACGKKQPEGNADPPEAPVVTQVARPQPILDTSEYLATLKSRRSAVIMPQVDGLVTQIFVKSGDRVNTGAPLLQIDPLKQMATVNNQEATRAAQLANVKFARDQLERAKKLYAAGVTSKQELDSAQTTLDAAEAQLKALDAGVRQQQVELRYYKVVAPTSGIVGDIPVHVGDRVTTSTVLTTVDQPGNLELYISVPVERSRELRLGEPVDLLDSNGKVIASSRVAFVSPQVENDTQSVLVKAIVGNPNGALRTYEFVRARVTWSSHQGLTIPVLAVSRISGQSFAFVVEKSDKGPVARQRLLHLGEMIGKNYVVLDGIKPGEAVVISGAQNLVDGTRVTETNAPR